MRKPDFKNLVPLFNAGEEFSLTEKQYLKSTGAPLPKNTYYLKKTPRFPRWRKKYGSVITVNERSICLKMI